MHTHKPLSSVRHAHIASVTQWRTDNQVRGGTDEVLQTVKSRIKPHCVTSACCEFSWAPSGSCSLYCSTPLIPFFFPLLTIINQLHQFALTVANNTCSNPLHLVRRRQQKKGKSLRANGAANCAQLHDASVLSMLFWVWGNFKLSLKNQIQRMGYRQK